MTLSSSCMSFSVWFLCTYISPSLAGRGTIGMTLELEPLERYMELVADVDWCAKALRDNEADKDLMEEDRLAALKREERKKAKMCGGLSCEYMSTSPRARSQETVRFLSGTTQRSSSITLGVGCQVGRDSRRVTKCCRRGIRRWCRPESGKMLLFYPHG